MAKRDIRIRKSGGASRARKTSAKKSARAAAGRSTRATSQSTRSKRTTSRSTRSRRTTTATAARGRGGRGRQMGRSTLHAKWIDSAADRADRPGQTLATRNPDVIQKWAEARGAEPATIATNDPRSPRVLRLNFPGFGGQSLQPVPWKNWLKTFEDRDLVFLFQERMKSGKQSNFFRLDNPNREDA